MKLRFLYVSLERDQERRARFLRQFPRVPWEHLPGIPGGPVWTAIGQRLGIVSATPERPFGRVRWGNIGCSLAHYFALCACAEDTRHDGIVLFPDDATNPRGHDLAKLCARALRHRPPGAGWLKLKNHFPRYLRRQKPWKRGGLVYRRLAAPDHRTVGHENEGSAAVILLREQARQMLDLHPAIDSTGIDVVWRGLIGQIAGGCWEIVGTGIGHEGGELSQQTDSTRIRINRGQ